MWVWHDANIPGHVFVCCLGLMLPRYLQWEARDPHLSVKALVERLEEIRLAVVSREGRPAFVLEEMGEEHLELVRRFHLLDQVPENS